MAANKEYIDKILANSSGKAKKKVLVIDNNRTFMGQIYRILMQHNFEVLSCTNANDALHKIERDIKIEAAVINAFLPENRGLTLLSALKSSRRHKDLPVVLTMDHGDESIVSKAIKSGVDGIILHPLNNQNVMSNLRKALGRGKETILIVDDDPVILDLLKHVIEVKKFNALTTTSGEHALKIMEMQDVSVIISDIHMPNSISGFELLEAVNQRNSSIPVILISGGAGQKYDKAANQAYAVIKKPFNNTALIKLLHQAVQDSKKQKELS